MATQKKEYKPGHSRPKSEYRAKPGPFSPEMEEAVAGMLMIDRDAFSLVSSILGHEKFNHPRCRLVIHAIESLSAEEKPVDILTVTEQLKKEGTLDEVGGPGYIASLSSKVASSAQIEYYANILAQKYLCREIMDFAYNLRESAGDETNDICDVYEDGQYKFEELGRLSPQTDFIQIDLVTGNVYRDILDGISKNGDLVGLPSGYSRLDSMTLGWQPSDLILIGGRPATGKSAFALSMIRHLIVVTKEPVGFFSLEMSSKELVRRLISNECGIELRKIKNSRMTNEEFDRLDKRINNLVGAPLYVDDTPGQTLYAIKRKARRMVKECGVKLIMIDFLQLIEVPSEVLSFRESKVEYLAYQLKNMAKDLNVPVIALTQLNRSPEKRDGFDGKRPQTSDMEGSGKLEQAANIVILLYRPETYDIFTDDNGNDLHGKVEVRIAKNRDGIADVRIWMDFIGKYMRFEEGDNGVKQLSLADYE